MPRITLFMLALLLVVSLRVPSAAAGDDGPVPTLHRENIEWTDIWIVNAADTHHPRVLLIGDSISRGYYKDVEKRLQGKVNLARIATSSAAPDPVLLEQVRSLLNHYHFDVIHFNNGLHGVDYSSAEYEAGMKKLVDLLEHESHGAKLIWATSTFVAPGFKNWKSDAWNHNLVATRNDIVEKLAKADHIPVDDLASVTEHRPELYNSSGIHYKPAGYAALGEQVARSILAVLGSKH